MRSWLRVVSTRSVLIGLLLLVFAYMAVGQVNPNQYQGMVWRNIGPFRAGRISAVSAPIGPGQAGIFYDGLPEGGVWKTESAGATWFPIFDSIKTASSVGSIAVAPSDPNVIYVGTGDLVGEGAIDEGDGVYKSTDAGKTWQHLGLEATKQIPAIAVDPKDPNIVIIAAQGDIHHPSEDRGLFRSTDGGRTWNKVLYKDTVTGAQDVEFAFDRPNVMFATTITHTTGGARGGAGGGGGRGAGNDGTAIYKSTDEGATWTQITSSSLPPLTGRTSVAVAMNTNAQRVYLVGGFGLYRSDDGGANWRKTITDSRIAGSGYICGVMVDTKNPDVVYVMNTSVYRSTDGGTTFAGWKGSPGGDDYHAIWIDPTDNNRMSLASDEGAMASLDGGHVWSTWYNQPTAQTYHIAVNNEFPYWVYGTQQDPCAVAEKSRGDFGETTPWDWTPLAIYESGSIAADPVNPDIIYGGGPDSGILKVFRKSGQWENVGPNIGAARGGPGSEYRKTAEQPIVFSPEDSHLLMLGTQYVTVTTDGGVHWRNLGNKDLATRTLTPEEEAAAAAAGGRGGGGRAGAVSSIAPSYKTANVIWTGSNNGVISVTQDAGNTWKDVSPKLPANANVVIMDASHSDPAEAYAAVDLHASGDYMPYIYRTRDFGAHWDLTVNGLPTGEVAGSFVRVVKEDTVKKGLLFAGTESSVYVSFDDGDHWQSLKLNLPIVSYRDLVVHDNDVVVGTFGRSFWVLDDIAPLRQITADLTSKQAYLFKPSDTIRMRKDVNRNTPLPPEIPHGLNPPYGAIMYYYLGSRPQGEIKLQIYDSANNLVRTLSSAPIPKLIANPAPNVPDYWFEEPQPMSMEPGTNRVVWDLHYEHPPSLIQNYSLEKFDALFHDTTWDPQGPFAIPGTYTAKLTVDGTVSTQTFNVLIDPRVKSSGQATQADLVAMHDVQMKAYKSMSVAWDGYKQVQDVRTQLKGLVARQLPPTVAEAATALDAKLAAIEGAPAGGRGAGGGGAAAAAGRGARGTTPPAIGFGALNIQFGGDGQTGYINAFGTADIAPTPAERHALQLSCTSLNNAINTWSTLKTQDVKAFNTLATQSSLPALNIPTGALPTSECGPPVSIAPTSAAARSTTNNKK